MKLKKPVVFGSIAAVFVFAVLLLVGRIYYPTNVAATAPDHAEAALRTRYYKTDLNTFRAETETIVRSLSTWGRSWKHIATEENGNSALVRAEVPVVVFTDDLWVKAERAADGVVVNVHSNSRVGKSDFGENRRHLLQILEALDARLGKN